MKANPDFAPGTPLGDVYRQRLEEMDYQRPVGPVRTVLCVLILVLAAMSAVLGAVFIVLGAAVGDWTVPVVGVTFWISALVLGLVAYRLGHRGRM